MDHNQPIERMTLRELINYAHKCSHDLHTHLSSTTFEQSADFRSLSRPVRRHSHFPTLIAVKNALEGLRKDYKEVARLADRLEQTLQAIRDHARRELVNRK